MGRGASRAKRHGGGGGGSAVNIKDMISSRTDENKQQVDDVLKVADVMTKRYGNDVAIEGAFQTGEMKGRNSNVLGYYDGAGNICMNSKYLNNQDMDGVMDQCFKEGYHPSRGNKSGMYAVAAHEYGHSLTANAAKAMGTDFDTAAERIVTEARKGTKHRGNIQFGAAISGYAKSHNAETIAEAYADVLCNGRRAKAESHAVVKTMDKYLKTGSKAKKSKKLIPNER